MFDTDGYGDGYKYAYPNFKRDVIREAQLDVEVQASGYAKKKTGRREEKDLEKAVMGMRIVRNEDDDLSEIESGEEDEDDEDDEDREYDENGEQVDGMGEYDSEDDLDEFNEGIEGLEEDIDADQEKAENEKIIEAISAGDKKLKMDKLGNYILEE
ncbi:hypothetical protein LELG_03098 [Lodderomyces elongisporus NRRL YB-4239]|nr:hypothetical protein LELG_03098 [Lodderomyces elongisporus NRRL YB-4239]